MNHREIHVFDDQSALSDFVIDQWYSISASAIEDRGVFRVALSGGTTPEPIFHAIARTGKDLPWYHTHLFFVDERFVTFDHPDSNYGMLNRTLLKIVPIAIEHIHPISILQTIEESAAAYEQRIKEIFGLQEGEIPRFDLIMLGIGEDGHTASLFPGHSALQGKDNLAFPVVHQVTNHKRITISLPVINNAREIIFLVTGEKKAAVVKEVIENRNPQLPAAMVQPDKGNVTFALDKPAASFLNT